MISKTTAARKGSATSQMVTLAPFQLRCTCFRIAQRKISMHLIFKAGGFRVISVSKGSLSIGMRILDHKQKNLQLLLMSDQQRKLQESKKTAKQYAYFMNKQLQNANLRRALRKASGMINQLSNQLEPRNYYVLFMTIFDQMRQLQKYFKQEYRRGRKIADLYALVQQSPVLLPRLYLLITVGSVFIQSHEIGSERILEDMLEMLKAVQNPLRGLFLRYYFLKMCKDRLPDTGSEYETKDRGINQAIQIIFTNLKQSVYLWIRLATDNNQSKSKMESHRTDVRVLIGEGLHRISSLEGVNLQIYKTVVFPKLTNLILSSKDGLAQQYLLDCMIQGFPGEFHVVTLNEILSMCTTELEKQVNMKLIFISLIDRISDYANSTNIKSDINLYELFRNNIDNLIERSNAYEFKNVLHLQSAFMKFVIKCYSRQTHYINQILKSAVFTCSKNESSIDEECQSFIVTFLTLPIESLSLQLLKVDEYPKLMKYLKYKKRREVANEICRIVIKLKMPLNELQTLNTLFNFIEPILKYTKEAQQISDILLRDERNTICKLIHLVDYRDHEKALLVYKQFVKILDLKDIHKIKWVYPTIIFSLFRLCNQFADKKPEQYKQIFDMCKSMLQRLSQIHPKLTIKLYLQFSQLINSVDYSKHYDQFTYEMITNGLLLYETEIQQAEQKIGYIKIIIAVLCSIVCISEENYLTLVTNVVSYCSNVLKKNEQCSLQLAAIHMFNTPLLKNQKKVIDMLRKCSKIATLCINQSINNSYLLVEIVNQYLHFSKYCSIELEEIKAAISVCTAKMHEFQKIPESKLCLRYWKATQLYISNLKIE